jgi:hypothetical protein
MKKLWIFFFCGAFVCGVSPAFAEDDISLALKQIPTHTSVGVLSIGASVLPGYETSTGPMPPSIEAWELQSYSYSSKCSWGGRYATWFPCTRIGTVSASTNFPNFHFGDIVNLTASFYSYKSSVTLSSVPVLPQTSFAYTVTLEDHNGGTIKPSTGHTYNNLNATGTVQYKVVFHTNSFKAESILITVK